MINKGWLMGISILDVLLGISISGRPGGSLCQEMLEGLSLCQVSRASKTASLPSASKETSSRRVIWRLSSLMRCPLGCGLL